MDKAAEVKKLLRNVVGTQNNLPLPAEVVSVEGDHCSVKINGLVLTEVKLKATLGAGENQLLVTPKVGSNVLLMSLTGELDNLTVIKIDEPESIQFTQNGLDFLLDGKDGKVAIQNEEISLADLFGELKTLVENLTVSTAVGPSGTPLPPTIQALADFKTNVDKLIK